MENTISYSPTGLFALSGEVLSGVKTYGVAIGLLHNTEAKVAADHALLTQAMEQYANGKTLEFGAKVEVRPVAERCSLVQRAKLAPAGL